MLPEDLLRGVAEDARGPGVPARHHALEVHRDQGVVVDVLAEQTQALLALAQARLGQLRRGLVAQHLAVAQQVPLRVQQRGHHAAAPEAAAVASQVPALVLDAARLAGEPELPEILALRHVLGREDDPAGHAERVGLRSAEDALGAAAPSDHPTVEVEADERVVLDAVEEHPQPLLTRLGVAPSLATDGELELEGGDAIVEIRHHETVLYQSS